MAHDGALTVLLADNHRLFREGLRDLLAEHEIEVAGEAEDASEAVVLAAEKKPSVVLTEINLPGGANGLMDMTRRLRFASPESRVVVLTVSADAEQIADAIHAGACGYLLKDASVDDIVRAVRAAARGESMLSPRIAAWVLARLREASPPPDRPEDLTARLTVREREVLRLMALGMDNHAIAAELVISEQTAKKHVSSVLAKLEVNNRIQAAVYAVRERIL
jgi:two-component system nitrate/nitrite response regulator NarL